MSLRDIADIAAILEAAVIVCGGAYAGKVWFFRQRPPFCGWCGLSNHAPRSELAKPCPRAPDGIVGHMWPARVGVSMMGNVGGDEPPE